MNYKIKLLLFIVLSILLFNMYSCKDKLKRSKDEIVVHLLSDPDRLNPYTSTTADASHIERYIFQKLIDYDHESQKFVPVLAVSMPKISANGSGLKLEYEIKSEAKWDNGSDVTAYDVLFSYKAVLNPKTNCEHIRPYFKRFVEKIEIDSTNPKKFTVYSKEKYILVEEYSGYWVLPEYVYDPKKLLRDIPLTTFLDTSSVKQNPNIILFADQFNSQLYSREKAGISGSGPYAFEEWITGRHIVLKKKDNWWGKKSQDTILNKLANISKLKFNVINDWATTTSAIKGGSLDCIKGIDFKSFDELKNEEKFNSMYHAYTPKADQYVYIGINLNRDKLKDIRVRQALAHCLDKNQIIETLLYGMGEPVESMVHPSKPYYNKNLTKYNLDLAKAKQLLDEAGWKDTDGDGIREQVINGKKQQLSLEFKYNSGNDTRKNIGLIFKENLSKIGVDVSIVSKEFTIFIDDLKKHDFDIYCGGWVGDPNVEDPTQLWHTESAKGGSNYVSYGDIESDRLIDQIIKELDENRRKELYLRFQEKVHNDIPYIFIYAPFERMAFSKRFSNAKAYTARPGVDLARWTVSAK